MLAKDVSPDEVDLTFVGLNSIKKDIMANGEYKPTMDANQNHTVVAYAPADIPAKKKGKLTSLDRRRQLYHRRCVANDVAFTLALIGGVLMVVETELTFYGVYDRDELPSFIMKSAISASTALLLCTLLVYHVINIQLQMFIHSIKVMRFYAIFT